MMKKSLNTLKSNSDYRNKFTFSVNLKGLNIRLNVLYSSSFVYVWLNKKSRLRNKNHSHYSSLNFVRDTERISLTVENLLLNFIEKPYYLVLSNNVNSGYTKNIYRYEKH